MEAIKGSTGNVYIWGCPWTPKLIKSNSSSTYKTKLIGIYLMYLQCISVDFCNIFSNVSIGILYTRTKKIRKLCFNIFSSFNEYFRFSSDFLKDIQKAAENHMIQKGEYI